MEPLVKTMVPEPDPIINYEELKRKIHSLSAHDIIMSMVEGLRNPRTKIDMRYFGYINDGGCFGCAATNTILHIMDANVDETKSHIAAICGYSPLRDFDYTIDKLRRGNLTYYNILAKALDYAHITPIPGQELPVLDNGYTEEQLQEYEKLAKYQLTFS